MTDNFNLDTMEFYRLLIIFSENHDYEGVYNDWKAANKAFNEATNHPFAIGANLYECEFVNNKLEDKNRILNWLKK